MSIVFSAIAPHPPILIPNIGKENTKLLEKTAQAYKELEENLYVSQPDAIVIISPHGPILLESFAMNLSPEYNANFQEFGDFSTTFKLSGDIGLAYKIRERLETRAPLQLVSNPDLDHGSSVPLYMLTPHLPKIKIVPIYYSGLNLDAHFKFGELLKREFLVNKNRMAVIASGDLSHRLSQRSPAGYSAKGKKFDQKILELLQKNNTGDILKINPRLVNDAGECGLKSIIILLGILSGIKVEPKIISYESPFGVGYAVVNYRV